MREKRSYFDYQILNVLSVARPIFCSILGHDIVIIMLVVLWLL